MLVPLKASASGAIGTERQEVIKAVRRTEPDIKILSVERVQNLSLWQTFVVKRQTIMQRERQLGHEEDMAHLERAWLFHGTSHDVVPKVCQTGFNRSYAGKHATRYGQGAYFARDASYSTNPLYAKPNREKQCFLFAVRVAVGKFEKGDESMIVPPPRPEVQNLNYDSTVNNKETPSIFVTYHDAQAYPEYLITYQDTD